MSLKTEISVVICLEVNQSDRQPDRSSRASQVGLGTVVSNDWMHFEAVQAIHAYLSCVDSLHSYLDHSHLVFLNRE